LNKKYLAGHLPSFLAVLVNVGGLLLGQSEPRRWSGVPFEIWQISHFFTKANRVSPNFQAKGALTMRNFSLCLGKKGKQSVTEFSGKSLTLLEKIKKLELPSALTSVQRMHKCLALAGCKIGDILGILGQITAPSARSLMPL